MSRRHDPLPVRLYRRLLAVLPRQFRHRRGEAMVAMLADAWRDAEGVRQRAMLLARALLDLLWTAVVERRGFSWLDFKLGLRMLVRHPGLTVVGGLAMAFAIFVGASTFQLVGFVVTPTVPVPDGDRVVGLRYWDREASAPVLPLPSDLALWREELLTVETLGASHTLERRLGNGGDDPVLVSHMSAAGFRVARVPPLLGRGLVEADDAPGADPVIVLAHRTWRGRFGSDPGVVGRVVRLGSAEATVVGVMPEDFGFPDRPHVWAPLRLDTPGDESGADVPLRVFARLAPGASLEEAQAELAAVTSRLPTGAEGSAREGRDRLVAEVLPYLESVRSVRADTLLHLMFYQLNAYALLFLVLVASNVALLMYARALAREREIVVRSALGASRGRIVMQLFVEALALSAVATVAGLAATTPALEWIQRQVREMGGDLPYGLEPTVSPGMVAYAVGLTLLGAVLAGVVPALKATGRGMRTRLHQASAGAGGLRLGGVWTVVVVVQVAATVVFTAGAYLMAHQAARSGSLEANFPAAQYLGVRVEMDGESTGVAVEGADPGFTGEYAARVRELERRLLQDPTVAGVTLTRQLPTKGHPMARVEADGSASGAADRDGAASGDGDSPGHRVATGAVDLDAFHVLQAPLLSGRGFDERDLEEGVRNVIVNASFVHAVLGGRSAVGRRVRYLNGTQPDEPAPWHRIVGVVRDVVADSTRSLDFQERPRARIYHPLDPARAESYPLHMVIHVRGDPTSLVPVLHQTAGAVNPALRLHQPVTLDWADPGLARGWRLYAELLSIVTAVALLLALAGIYAVMSFTVAQRRREIGVRVALGADAPRVVAETFRKPLTWIGTGVAAGCLLVGLCVQALTSSGWQPETALLLVSLGTGMLAVCGAACVVPTLRALGVEPAVVLSAEG